MKLATWVRALRKSERPRRGSKKVLWLLIGSEKPLIWSQKPLMGSERPLPLIGFERFERLLMVSERPLKGS